jgi:hypothetical protein
MNEILGYSGFRDAIEDPIILAMLHREIVTTLCKPAPDAGFQTAR